MEQEELDELMAETARTLRDLGIPVSREILPSVQVNTRARRRLGCCYYRDRRYTVEVSAKLLDRPEMLRTTLAHELLHTCRGCRNHGETWKTYAARANAALGLEIARLSPADEEETVPLRNETVKYVLECQSCGALIRRSRMSKAVRSPWRYRCKCGGKLKRIQ